MTKDIEQAMAEFTAYLLQRQEANPVHCDGCTACCKGRTVVVLQPSDDPGMYAPEHLQMADYDGEKRLSLAFQSNGDCVFLRNSKCMAYDRRPLVCRTFDCRRAMYSYRPEDREFISTTKVFNVETWDAGVKRMPTMKLEPMEEQMYAAFRRQTSQEIDNAKAQKR